MLSRLYAKWMYSWETALTTRDTNRIVRPLEWGFDWLEDFRPLAPKALGASQSRGNQNEPKTENANRCPTSRSSDFCFPPAPPFHGEPDKLIDYDRMIAINHD